VYVESAEAGTWTVEVEGYNVPNGPQPFALVVDGTFGPPPTPTYTPTPGTPTATPTPTFTPTPTNTPTPTPTPGATMHVGDLDGSSGPVGKKGWEATVEIEVHDASHSLVANATVDGTWSGGAKGSDSCTTNASGRCSIASGKIPDSKPSTTFTVDDVTHATLTYDPGANHDPDGDSDGTSITIFKP
jgi:hypothetical protein